MSGHIISQPGSPRCIGTHTVVLYDAKTGRVHHQHHAFIFEGPRPAHDFLEQVARKNAAHVARGAKLPPLEALHVTDTPLASGKVRVDVAQRKLVSES